MFCIGLFLFIIAVFTQDGKVCHHEITQKFNQLHPQTVKCKGTDTCIGWLVLSYRLMKYEKCLTNPHSKIICQLK